VAVAVLVVSVDEEVGDTDELVLEAIVEETE